MAEKQNPSAAPGAGTTTSKQNALRKVDYLEYLEGNGRAVIDFMRENAEAVNKSTTVLRERLSQTQSSHYKHKSYDNWSQVNYYAVPQWQIRASIAAQ